MSTYNYTLVVVIQSASGAGAVPSDVEAAMIADFEKRVRNSGAFFGIGTENVTLTLVP